MFVSRVTDSPGGRLGGFEFHGFQSGLFPEIVTYESPRNLLPGNRTLEGDFWIKV